MIDERGDTLIEILVALGLLGLVVAAVAGALIGSASASSNEKVTVTLDAALRSFAESMRAEVADAGRFNDCATARGGRAYPVASVPSPAAGPRGTVVTVFVTGFPPGSTIDVQDLTADTPVQPVALPPVDGHGDATLVFAVNAVNGSTGPHQLSFTSGATSVTQTFEVADPTTGSPPPGSDLQGYTIEVTNLQWWDGSTGPGSTGPGDYVEPANWGPPSGSPLGVTCPSNGLQLVTVTGTGPGGVESDLTFAMSNSSGSAPELFPSSPVSILPGGTATLWATGYPVPTISKCPNADSAITLSDHHDGRATLAASADAAGGIHHLCVTAANGITPDATEDLTVVVETSPGFNPPSEVTFLSGVAGQTLFVVSTTGYPPVEHLILCGSDPPSGISFVDNGNGTAAISYDGSTPPGRYQLCVSATNGVAPDATETVTIDVFGIDGAGPWDLRQGTTKSFTVTSSGAPAAVQFSVGGSATCTETFPARYATVDSNPDATATVTLGGGGGDPGPIGPGPGTYTLCLRASAGSLPVAERAITVVVGTPPSVSFDAQGDRIDLSAGQFVSVRLSAGGFPAPGLAVTSGRLPDGLTLNAATGVISGQPAATDLGDHTVTVTATNNFGTASDTADLHVDG